MLWFYPVFLSPGDRRWVPLFAATAGGMWRRSQSRATLWHWQSLQGCLWSLMSVAFGRSLPQTLSMLRIGGTMLSLQIVKSWVCRRFSFMSQFLEHVYCYTVVSRIRMEQLCRVEMPTRFEPRQRGICHRLDSHTSGVQIFGKSWAAFKHFVGQNGHLTHLISFDQDSRPFIVLFSTDQPICMRFSQSAQRVHCFNRWSSWRRTWALYWSLLPASCKSCLQQVGRWKASN